MQNEIIDKTVLLDGRGNVAEPGWAKQSLYEYDRKKIKAPAFRIKEWDYYAVLSSDWGLALTAADNGYMGFFAMTLFDFAQRTEVSGTVMTVMPLGKYRFPSSASEGDVVIEEKDIRMSFRLDGEKRRLKMDYPAFDNGAGITADIELTPPEGSDRMVIATPFEKRGHFYFNEKHNCLAARGTVKSGDLVREFGPGDYGVLDWGRGVWTYENTWYWGSASGEVDGLPFGFNIGYGFGDTSAATENMLFYGGRAHKLEHVKFHIPGEPEGAERYTEPWTFTSSDGRFELDFVPMLDRSSDSNVLIIRSAQHQVFGHFSGKVVLDDGRTLEIKNLLGFAEKVYNKW